MPNYYFSILNQSIVLSFGQNISFCKLFSCVILFSMSENCIIFTGILGKKWAQIKKSDFYNTLILGARQRVARLNKHYDVLILYFANTNKSNGVKMNVSSCLVCYGLTLPQILLLLWASPGCIPLLLIEGLSSCGC